MEEKDEIVISLSDVWNIIKKNAAFIIVVTLICAIGSFFITRYFIPKLYTSSIQLYVDTSNDDENKNNLNILSEQTYAQNLVATYIKMLNTNTFYTELSEHINNKYTAKQLSEMVSFSSDEKTEIFDAKVTTSSPNDSKLIADAVGKVAPEAISRLKSKATLKIVDYVKRPFHRPGRETAGPDAADERAAGNGARAAGGLPRHGDHAGRAVLCGRGGRRDAALPGAGDACQYGAACAQGRVRRYDRAGRSAAARGHPAAHGAAGAGLGYRKGLPHCAGDGHGGK